MAAYAIAQIKVTDAAAFAEYRDKVGETVEAFGGTYLARGGKVEVLEGEWSPDRTVVIRFESMEKARAWYHSEAYAPLLKLRLSASRGNLVLVEGL